VDWLENTSKSSTAKKLYSGHDKATDEEDDQIMSGKEIWTASFRHS